MDNIQKTNKKRITPALSIAIPGIVLFVCAVLFTPNCGVLRTIPFFIAGGMVSALFSTSLQTICALTAILTLCTYLASGRTVGQSLLFAFAACLLATAGVYIHKFIKAYRTTEKTYVKKKCIRAAAFTLVVAVLLSLVLCGNAMSFIVADSENTDYMVFVKNNGGADMHKKYTSYEAFNGAYCTYVTFKDEGGVYGNADDYCILFRDGKPVDGVRDYFEEKLLYSANARLASVVSGATWGFNITASDIDFKDNEVLPVFADVDDYADRIRYVVSFDSLIDETEQDKFVSVCKDTVTEIKKSGISFDRILLCGGNAADVLFCITVNPDTEPSDVSDMVERFEESLVEPYGVTEMTILDYWKNK